MSLLTVGTVQFGLDYGIANKSGKTPEQETKKIIQRVLNEGIDRFDTASLYGNSESVLGRCLPECSGQIITKTPHFLANKIDQEQIDLLRMTFMHSLQRLRRERIEGLMIHHADDLCKAGGVALWDCMHGLKRDGLVNKIGVSVYTSSQIDNLLSWLTPDIVQLPLNIFDQRLIKTGHLDRLKDKGVQIYVRSAYLQGLLLLPIESLGAYFDPYRTHIDQYRNYIEKSGLTPIEAALGFVMSQPNIDYVVVGGCSVTEWEQTIEASKVEADFSQFKQFAVDDPALVNPAIWKIG
jgi:aryl-alcohol dehydrogenase-like predicted oxidoreductase